MLQYYAIGAHFAAEGQSELFAHFYEQAEEEKKDALRIIQFVIDTGARVNISAVAVSPVLCMITESRARPLPVCGKGRARLKWIISVPGVAIDNLGRFIL
jgi:hypothetical protein